MATERQQRQFKTKRQHTHFEAHCYLNGLYALLRSHHYYGLWHGLFVFSSSLATAILALLQFMDVKNSQETGNLPVWLKELSSDLYAHRFVVACLMLAMVAVTGGLAALTGFIRSRCVKNLDLIKKALGDAVEEHFDARRNGETYRATLFRAFHCPGLGSWLGIVQRSPDIFVNWRAIFCIDPQHNKHCTGIAGECWWNAHAGLDSQFYVKMPTLEQDGALNLEYLDQGFLDEREFRRIAKASIFFHATDIRVDGKVWGVLVLDSSDPEVFADTKPKRRKHDEVIFQAVSDITRLLE